MPPCVPIEVFNRTPIVASPEEPAERGADNPRDDRQIDPSCTVAEGDAELLLSLQDGFPRGLQRWCRDKLHGLVRFWRFMDCTFPEVRSSAGVRPSHVQAYIPHTIASARANSRPGPSATSDGTVTANHDLASIRTFFSDIAVWSAARES